MIRVSKLVFMTVDLIVIIEHMMNAGHISYISCYFHPDPIPGNKIEWEFFVKLIIFNVVDVKTGSLLGYIYHMPERALVCLV